MEEFDQFESLVGFQLIGRRIPNKAQLHLLIQPTGEEGWTLILY